MKRWIYGIIVAAAVAVTVIVSVVSVAYQPATQIDTPTDERPIESEESPAETQECEGTALCISGRVEGVIDGDTLTVQGYRVRLSLVNTPERNQAGFEEAKSFAASLCPVGSDATVDQDDGQPLDRYNRMLGKVLCSGKVLNAELLHNGHAEILTRYCPESEFASEPWAKAFGC